MDTSARRLLSIIAAAVGLIIFFSCIYLFLLKVIWAWIIPQIFPGAVEQGLITRNLSWFLALKIALSLAVLKSFVYVSLKREGKDISGFRVGLGTPPASPKVDVDKD